MQDVTAAIDPEYGRKIASALQAVWQMHKDCSGLLREVDTLVSGHASDGPMRGWTPVHGSFITSDLSWEMKRGYYMAEGLYRYYVQLQSKADLLPLKVRGLTIAFFNANGQSLAEPMLIGSDFTYLAKAPRNGKTQSVWDAWDTYFAHRERADLGKRLTLGTGDFPSQLSHVSQGSLLACPIYDIQSRLDVENFCHRAWL